MIIPPEDLSPLPVESPSILGRIGQQTANLPSNTLNEMMRLGFNLGIGDQNKPYEVPKPYDIPEAKSWGETAVDVGAALLPAAIPFIGGEKLAVSAADAIEAGPLLTRMMKLGGGFAAGGAVESPEQAAVGGATGAAMGAVEHMLPGPLRYLAAAGLGTATGLEAKREGATDNQAVVTGATNALLPLLFGRRRPTVAKSIVTEETKPFLGPKTGDIGSSNNFARDPSRLHLEGEREYIPPPEGSIVREPALTEGEALRAAEVRQSPPAPILRLSGEDELPFRNRNGSVDVAPINRSNGQLNLPLPPPEGSIIREPIFTPTEARRSAGVTPPDGSLIREPTFTQGEALKYAEGKTPKEVATLQSQTPIASKSRVLLSTVLTHENETVANAAAKKLDLKFDGIIGDEATGRKLQFTPTGGGSTIAIPVGATFKDLKNAQVAMKERMARPRMTPEEAKAKLAELRQSQEKKAGITSFSNVEFADNSNDTTPLHSTNLEQKNLLQFRSAFKEPNGKIIATKEVGGHHYQLQVSDKAIVGFIDSKGKFYTRGQAAEAQKVATLQQSPPSPLETVLPHNLKVGDKAVAFIDGERTVGTIHSTVEPQLPVRFVTKDGTPHDLAPTQISPLGKKPPPSSANVEAVGGLTDIDSAVNAAKREGGALTLGESGGKMKLSNFGEHGGATPEVLSLIARYVAAPAIGAAVGYAEDENHRLGSAIAGAAIGGLLAVGGARIIRRLALGHPEVGTAGSFAERVSKIGTVAKEDAVSIVKAITGNESMAARAASRWGLSSDYDKMARGLEKVMGVNPAVARFMGKARGLVNEYANIMHTAVNGLSHIEGVEQFYPELTKYFEGTLTHSELASKVTEEVSALSATAIQARTALQKVAIEGLGEGKLATAVTNSIGKYLTTAYRIFHDAKYLPTDDQITAAAKSLSDEWGNLETRIDDINNYLHEVKTGKALWGSSGGKSVSSLLTRTRDLTPEFKDMLGMYENPLERMSFTAVKLVNGARSAEFFNEVARGLKDNGLKYAYSTTEREATIATLQSQARLAHSPAEREIAAAKLKDLQSYVRNTDGLSTGRLSNKFLDRRMRDQLANYTADTKAHMGTMARGILEATNAIKYGQIILSPLQFVRQVYQMPVLGLMAKTTPVDWVKAAKTILFDKSAEGVAELARLKRLGVFEGTSQAAELREDIKSLMDGTLDRKIGQRLSHGLHKWEEMWRTPDLIVRVSSFQRKEAQLLELYGSGQADRAANEAIDHMNRYTMNYGAVPPIVKLGRQLPFVNQYLSFAYEAMRITKNLGEDATKGDLYAMGVLATVVTSPFIIQQMSEAQLSPTDREEWQKVKALGQPYERHNFRFVQGRLPNGDFRYISFSPLVLHDPWLQSIRAIMAGDVEALGAANPVVGWENTPLLNVATTFVSGRNRFTGKALHGFGDYVQDIRTNVAPILLGTDLDRIKRALTPNDQGGRGVIDTRSGKVSSIDDVLQTYATSMRPYTVRPSYLLRQAQAEAVDRIRSQQLTYRGVLATNASPEVKQQAKENFDRAMTHILLSYKERFGISLSPEQENSSQ